MSRILILVFSSTKKPQNKQKFKKVFKHIFSIQWLLTYLYLCRPALIISVVKCPRIFYCFFFLSISTELVRKSKTSAVFVRRSFLYKRHYIALRHVNLNFLVELHSAANTRYCLSIIRGIYIIWIFILLYWMS